MVDVAERGSKAYKQFSLKGRWGRIVDWESHFPPSTKQPFADSSVPFNCATERGDPRPADSLPVQAAMGVYCIQNHTESKLAAPMSRGNLPLGVMSR
jgi:hypothetical protein